MTNGTTTREVWLCIQGNHFQQFAAKLAVGYSLDELQNDVTKETPACFEPSIDYVVTKMPHYLEKFVGADSSPDFSTGPQDAAAIGRTFKESANASLEIGLKGFEAGKAQGQELDKSLSAKAETIRRTPNLFVLPEEWSNATTI